MSDSDDQATWRLRGSAPEQPDNPTVALGPAGDLVQSWAAVPLAGEDAAPASDPATALLETVRFEGTGTVREPVVDAGADVPTEALPTTVATEPLPPATGATELPTAVDPTAAEVPTPAEVPPAVAEVPPAPAGMVRFGPGVPAAGASQAAAVWHGAAAPDADRPPRRRRAGYVLIALVLLALLGPLLWRRYGPALAVDGVAVSTAPGTLRCDGTEPVTATVRTSGSGTLRYHWVRNDGTDSGPLSRKVAAGSRTVRLPLRWTFHGHGTYHATATLDVDAPDRQSASVSFTYACAR